MLYYLGGPMTGYPEYNFPEFERIANELRKLGYKIRSAHEVDYGETAETRGGRPYTDYIRGDLMVMLSCQAAIFHGRHDDSKGCDIEKTVARFVGMPMYVYCDSGCGTDLHALL